MKNTEILVSVIIISIIFLFSFTISESYAYPNEQEGTKKVNGFEIDYSITNGYFANIVTDVDAISLIVTIRADKDGTLEITMPRKLIDSSTGEKDDVFLVLVGNNFPQIDNLQEIKTTEMIRTLRIPFHAGTDKIEIIGTTVHIENNNSEKDDGDYQSIDVQMGLPIYEFGETIKIYGNIPHLSIRDDRVAVKIMVTNPNHRTVIFESLKMDFNGDFAYYVTAGGTEKYQWDIGGMYNVEVEYKNLKGETSFHYTVNEKFKPESHDYKPESSDKIENSKLNTKIAFLEKQNNSLISEIKELKLSLENLDAIVMEQIKVIIDLMKK